MTTRGGATEAEVTAAIAIGSNLGDAAANVSRALVSLGRIGGTRVSARSSLYRSAPVGPGTQPDYVNAAALVVTTLPPFELLAALQSTEDRLGRRRLSERWGPRIIDLDIVTYANREIAGQRLTVPHPEAHHRCFVLVPLAEIAPGMWIPGYGRVTNLVKNCDTGEVHRIAPAPENE